jgi:polyisoprenoid-binding protein YceI
MHCNRWQKTLAVAGFLLVALIGPLKETRAEPARYILDKDHLSIAFLVEHIGFAKTLGMFRKAEGSFSFDDADLVVSDISVSIDAASVFTNHKARDKHLRSKDFLAAAKYPKITFVGTSSDRTGPRTGTVTGDLTIRGVTRPVVLDVTWNRTGAYPFGAKHTAIGISARANLKRTAFGMNYAAANGWVGDAVEIIIEFEAKLKK